MRTSAKLAVFLSLAAASNLALSQAAPITQPAPNAPASTVVAQAPEAGTAGGAAAGAAPATAGAAAGGGVSLGVAVAAVAAVAAAAAASSSTTATTQH